jgi:hypothetical protein
MEQSNILSDGSPKGARAAEDGAGGALDSEDLSGSVRASTEVRALVCQSEASAKRLELMQLLLTRCPRSTRNSDRIRPNTRTLSLQASSCRVWGDPPSHPHRAASMTARALQPDGAIDDGRMLSPEVRRHRNCSRRSSRRRLAVTSAAAPRSKLPRNICIICMELQHA